MHELSWELADKEHSTDIGIVATNCCFKRLLLPAIIRLRPHQLCTLAYSHLAPLSHLQTCSFYQFQYENQHFCRPVNKTCVFSCNPQPYCDLQTLHASPRSW